MALAIEIIRSFHFLFVLLGSITLMLWVQEEFESILKRKKIVGLRFLKISFFKKIFEQNNLKQETAMKSLVTALRGFLTICPLMLIPFSNEVIIEDITFRFGLYEQSNSFILFVLLIISNELFRILISESSVVSEKNILLLLIFLASFLLIDKFYTFDQILEYQKSYSILGIRKYLIYINPVGAIALFQIIINEIDNPGDSFDIIKTLLINCYLILFIYCFLGGYSAPTFINFGEGSFLNALVGFFSFFSKYIFILVSVWVYRFVFVKRKKEIIFNEF